ncbi:MAG: OmpA family protein [Thermodesulfobacteriota bacterium]
MQRHWFLVIGLGVWATMFCGCHPSHWQRSEEGVSGHIRIESATADADITVNGREAGRTPLDLPVSYLGTTPLRITAVAVNHPELKQELTVELPPIPEKIIVLNFDAPASLEDQMDEDGYDDGSRKGTDAGGGKPEIIEKTIVTEKYILPPVVFFDTDRYNVKKRYLKELEQFAAFMKNNRFSLEIIGFADERHNVPYNQVLSLQRAQAVYDALKGFGLEESRMRVEGRGKLYTIDHQGKRFAWEHDRRVEIQLREVPQ